MDDIFISFEPDRPGRFIRIMRISFGVLCIAAGLFWLFFCISDKILNVMMLIAILFITLFGIYSILLGLGKTRRYISFDTEAINIKQHAISTTYRIPYFQIKSVEIHPLSIIFFFSDNKKYTLRFGTMYSEVIGTVKGNVEEVCNRSSIPFSYAQETIFQGGEGENEG